MSLAIFAGNYHFSRVGQGDAAKHFAVFLDAGRKKTFFVFILPALHTLIKLAHGFTLEVEYIPLVFFRHGASPFLSVFKQVFIA